MPGTAPPSHGVLGDPGHLRRAGIFDPRADAHDLHRLPLDLARAADALPAASIRLWTGDRFLVASSLALAETGPHGLPGTIINSGPDWLRVSVADGSRDVRLLDLRELDGSPADLSAERFAVARRLSLPPNDALAAILRFHDAAAPIEHLWSTDPTVTSSPSLETTPSDNVQRHDLSPARGDDIEWLITTCLAAYAGATPQDAGMVLLHTSAMPIAGEPASHLYHTHVAFALSPVPRVLPIRSSPAWSVARAGPMARDIAARRSLRAWIAPPPLSLAVELGMPYAAPVRADITLRTPEGAGHPLLLIRPSVAGEPITARIHASLVSPP